MEIQKMKYLEQCHLRKEDGKHTFLKEYDLEGEQRLKKNEREGSDQHYIENVHDYTLQNCYASLNTIKIEIPFFLKLIFQKVNNGCFFS